MANRYWVGGSGNWNDTNHWSATYMGTPGASVPGAADNAYFPENTTSGATVTIDINFTVLRFYVYNSYVPLNINFNGKNCVCTALTGFQFSTDATGTIDLTNATLTAQYFDFNSVSNVITTGSTLILKAVGLNDEVILNDDLDRTYNNIVFDCNAQDQLNRLKLLVPDGKTWTIGTLSLTNTAATNGLYTFYFMATSSGTGIITVTTWSLTGSQSPNTHLSFVYGNISMASGTVNVEDCSFSYMAFSGGVTFVALTTNDNVDDGNNSGIYFTPPPENRYWVGDGGTWDGSTTTHWSATSGGSGGASAPTQSDNVIFDANSFTTASPIPTVTIDTTAVCVSLTASGCTNSPAFVLSGNITMGAITINSTTAGGVASFTSDGYDIAATSLKFYRCTVDLDGSTVTLTGTAAFSMQDGVTLSAIGTTISIAANGSLDINVPNVPAAVNSITGTAISVCTFALNADITIATVASTTFTNVTATGYSIDAQLHDNVDGGGNTNIVFAIYVITAPEMAVVCSLGTVTFTCFLNTEFVTTYTCLLDDLAVPMSSFQGRFRSGDPSFLSVVTPGTDLADDISAMFDFSSAASTVVAGLLGEGDGNLVIPVVSTPSGPVLSVSMVKTYADGNIISEQIMSVILEDVRIDEGSSNQSITLSGHQTTTYSVPFALSDMVLSGGGEGGDDGKIVLSNPPAVNPNTSGKIVTLTGASYKLLTNGNLRYRCTPDMFLRPGDVVSINGDYFRADEINFTISPESQVMEVAEA